MISIPEFCLVLLVGPSGSGKSTFAARHFLPTEVVSSDFCRGLVADDENDQSASAEAFDLLHTIVAKRLKAMRLTVVDATNLQSGSRRPLLALARQYHVLPVVIAFDLPESVCVERNLLRSDRNFGSQVVRGHVSLLRKTLRELKKERVKQTIRFGSAEEVESASLAREPLYNNRRTETGPFDLIGDVHGCLSEMETLLATLGYAADGSHPDDRKLVFLGDLVDRGPDSPGVLRKVMALVAAGRALMVPGNHDVRLMRKLKGKTTPLTHGLAETVAQLDQQPPEFSLEAAAFIDGLTSHLVLDGGRLVVAHAGLQADMHGRTSGAVRNFCLYGETTGETDEYGLPIRYVWAADYRGEATVVYGHTPIPEPIWLNKTINIDTGCVFGGRLTALRYPEGLLVSVPAERTYVEPVRPLAPVALPESSDGDVLDLADFQGRRIVSTRYTPPLTIREENGVAALEALSRFAVDPRWLIYLPPTMSPSDTSGEDGYLEHPQEALGHYRAAGQTRVICQEKHMGSRAVVVVCRNEDSARRRFRVESGVGAVYTRTGRAFFPEESLQTELLERLRAAITVAGWWERFGSDWFCLDCELMPWSLKADALVREQYAAVGCAARASLGASVALLENGGPPELLALQRRRLEDAELFTQAYRRYCWPVLGLEGARLAPFHLLAAERRTFFEEEHIWHLATLSELGRFDPLFTTTDWLEVDLGGDGFGAVDWWLQRTGRGSEGMVVKPWHFLRAGATGRWLQPAMKCRGREYLRIIYGPEYTELDNLSRLRKRSLGAKRKLAMREFHLGLEGLQRFVEFESLTRVHECIFGVLALESEPVDSRL